MGIVHLQTADVVISKLVKLVNKPLLGQRISLLPVKRYCVVAVRRRMKALKTIFLHDELLYLRFFNRLSENNRGICAAHVFDMRSLSCCVVFSLPTYFLFFRILSDVKSRKISVHFEIGITLFPCLIIQPISK